MGGVGISRRPWSSAGDRGPDWSDAFWAKELPRKANSVWSLSDKHSGIRSSIYASQIRRGRNGYVPVGNGLLRGI